MSPSNSHRSLSNRLSPTTQAIPPTTSSDIDAAQRKRLQNRLAQRTYRHNQKMKLRALEEAVGRINQEGVTPSGRLPEERLLESSELGTEIDLENPSLISAFDTDLDLAGYEVPAPASEESSNSVVRRLTPPHDGSESVWSSDILLPLPQLDVCRPPLHLSASKGNVSMTRLLLERGANTAIQDSTGQTALHLAVEQGQAKVVQLLLTCKGTETVNARDSIGRTALFNAVERGHSDIVRALLEASIDVNARDIYGHAALHVAVASGSESLTILLLSSGADINS